MIGNKTIKQLDHQLEADLKKELRDQGHYLTGALERSMKPRISEPGQSVILEVEAEDYINDLEEGIPPEHIEYNAAYIQEMAEYARKRMRVSGRQALRIGAAIARKHTEEGNPTANSYQFSSTGERLHAIETSYETNEKDYDRLIDQGLSEEIDQYIDQNFDITFF